MIFFSKFFLFSDLATSNTEFKGENDISCESGLEKSTCFDDSDVRTTDEIVQAIDVNVNEVSITMSEIFEKSSSDIVNEQVVEAEEPTRKDEDDNDETNISAMEVIEEGDQSLNTSTQQEAAVYDESFCSVNNENHSRNDKVDEVVSSDKVEMETNSEEVESLIEEKTIEILKEDLLVSELAPSNEIIADINTISSRTVEDVSMHNDSILVMATQELCVVHNIENDMNDDVIIPMTQDQSFESSTSSIEADSSLVAKDTVQMKEESLMEECIEPSMLSEFDENAVLAKNLAESPANQSENAAEVEASFRIGDATIDSCTETNGNVTHSYSLDDILEFEAVSTTEMANAEKKSTEVIQTELSSDVQPGDAIDDSFEFDSETVITDTDVVTSTEVDTSKNHVINDTFEADETISSECEMGGKFEVHSNHNYIQCIFIMDSMKNFRKYRGKITKHRRCISHQRFY